MVEMRQKLLLTLTLLIALSSTALCENKAKNPAVSVYSDDFTEELQLGEARPPAVFPSEVTFVGKDQPITDVIKVMKLRFPEFNFFRKAVPSTLQA